MACFIAPATAAIVTTAIRKKAPSRLHLNWLLALLWGGDIWLVPKHIYHGEVTFVPPFFTADASHIVREVLRVGVPMVGMAIIAWVALVAIANRTGRQMFQPRLAFLLVLGAILMIAVDRVLA